MSISGIPRREGLYDTEPLVKVSWVRDAKLPDDVKDVLEGLQVPERITTPMPYYISSFLDGVLIRSKPEKESDSAMDSKKEVSKTPGLPASAVPAVVVKVPDAPKKREHAWTKNVATFKGSDVLSGSTGGESVKAKGLKLSVPDCPGALAGTVVKLPGIVEGKLGATDDLVEEFSVKGDFKLEATWPEGLHGRLGGGLVKLEFLT